MESSILSMEGSIGERLIELLSALPNPGQDVNNSGIIEIHEHTTTTVEDQDKSEEGELARQRNLTDDLLQLQQRMLYHEDPAVVAAAAAAAAVKFRSNYLPPIGVFWDIENCQVPKGRSAMAVTRVIRDRFFTGYKEAEFIVVCDVQKENKQIVQELNDAQVDLIHVSATCKNAADEKLRQSIRRFADTHGSPSAIILISGDINFAADLSDLRHRKKIHVILLHKENTSEALILCADEHYDFTKLLQPLPSRTPVKVAESYDLLVCNLPDDKDVIGIKRRLKQLSNNCGGRVVQVRSNAAVVRFCSKESADRAQKRMHGEYVFDSKISVKYLKDKDLCCGTQKKGNSVARESTASESEAVNENTNAMYGLANTVGNVRSLPGTPHYPTTSPVVGNCTGWNGMQSIPQGVYPSQPSYMRPPYMSGNANKSFEHNTRSQSPQVWQMQNSFQHSNRHWDDYAKARDYSSSESSNFRNVKIPPAHGRGGSASQQTEWNLPRPPWSALNSQNNSGFNHPHKRRSPSPLLSSQNQDNGHWNSQIHSTNVKRAPSPYEGPVALNNSLRMDHMSSFRQSDGESEEIENLFNPICNRLSSNGLSHGTSFAPIELQVTNLDQNIDPKDMKRILTNIFMEHVAVVQVSIFIQSDGNFAAIVKVPTLSDAQFAISQLHRRKVGYKRMLISYVHTSGPNPQVIRSQIVMLLQEVPGHKLPLFTFREMYESRFMISISISELYKMKDVCTITDDSSGRMVALNPDHRNTPSPCLNSTMEGQSLEMPFCMMHASKPWSNKGWAEQEMASLPNIKLPLKKLSERVHKLLSSHSGFLPLPSFPCCYEAEFHEPLDDHENGVPLEHLISCLNTVEMKQGCSSVKHITWATGKNNDQSNEENSISPQLASQLALFSRELVDLLKTAPQCQLSFNRFIPAYHHHFGRQCRVADYGFTKLIDLLENLTHTVQVMGEGNKRVVTLSHRAQIRRFSSDLLRILKAQASKQVLLSEFPTVYARVIGKPWDVADYGVCELDDILGEVSESTVIVTVIYPGTDQEDRLIAIPKREQTAKEIEKTKQFAKEVVELLKHAPQQRMLFNKFVPSYHHHFGHQCRVSDYGFTKLIELFEAIPDIVKIDEVNGGERRISLTEKEAIRVLGEQITKIITVFGNLSTGQLMLSNIPQTFLNEFGYMLRPELFNCKSMLQLMEKLDGIVKVVNTKNGLAVITVDRNIILNLGLECRKILMDAPNHRLSMNEFQERYEQLYHKKCAIEKYVHNLENYIQIFNMNNESFIQLTALQAFACNVQRVLIHHNGKINLSQFEGAYLKVIGTPCRAAQYGFSTLTSLLQAIPCTVVIENMRHKRKLVLLNKKLAAFGLLPSSYSSSASPQQDTDSSLDSSENDFSSSCSKMSSTKWDSNQLQTSSSWNNDSSKWEKKQQHWALSNTSHDSQKWANTDSSFYETVQRSNEFPLPPPKPDSPENEQNKGNNWFSIWATSPKFNYEQSTSSKPTVVDIPPLTLSPLKQISPNNPLNLVSPAKYLLPATDNPLDGYGAAVSRFASPTAPHPSELPLPSMSFTPKKDEQQKDKRESFNSPVSSKNEKSDIDSCNPSKRSSSGKRRLAAQFNQPPSDS